MRRIILLIAFIISIASVVSGQNVSYYNITYNMTCQAVQCANVTCPSLSCPNVNLTSSCPQCLACPTCNFDYSKLDSLQSITSNLSNYNIIFLGFNVVLLLLLLYLIKQNRKKVVIK